MIIFCKCAVIAAACDSPAGALLLLIYGNNHTDCHIFIDINDLVSSKLRIRRKSVRYVNTNHNFRMHLLGGDIKTVIL